MKSAVPFLVSLGALAAFTGVMSTVVNASDLGVRALPKIVPASLETVQSTEFETETRAVVDATATFFDEVEAASSPSTPQIRIEGGTAQEISFLATSNEARALSSSHGPMKRLTGYDITFYPVDRLLGTVDFMGTWGTGEDLVCGYLTWDLTDPQNPVLDSIKADFIDDADLGGLSDDGAYARLLDANCAYGAVAENHALLIARP